MIYDARDETRPIAQYVERLAAHWYGRLATMWGRPPADIGRQQLERIVTMLRPDFDFRPRLSDLAAVAAQDILRLTAEQVEIAESLAEAQRVVVKGSAGTGENCLAIEEAKRLAGSGARVLLVCFNVRLASVIRDAVSDARVRVLHFHGLVREIVETAGRGGELPDAEESYIVEVALPELAFDIVAGWSDSERFDALVIDEAQDLLRPEYLAVLEGLLSGGFARGRFRAFLDPKQNAFGGHVAEGMRAFEEAGAMPFRLTKTAATRNQSPPPPQCSQGSTSKRL